MADPCKALDLLTPLRSLVPLKHAGGAVKHVELVGFSAVGRKRALIHWPTAGQYEIDLNDGRIVGAPPTLTAAWTVERDVLEQLRASELAQRAKGRQRRKRPPEG